MPKGATKRTPPDQSDPTEAPAPLSAIETLTLKQRALVKAVAVPDSPTFGNQTRSYMAVYGEDNPIVAKVKASVQLRNGNSAVALRDEIERQGLGAEVRVGVAREIVAGRHRALTRTVSRKAKDGSVVTESESSPRAQDVVKVLGLLDRWDGSDAARQAEGAARATALKELTRRIMATLPHAQDGATAHVEASSVGDACVVEPVDVQAQTGAQAQACDAGAGGQAQTGAQAGACAGPGQGGGGGGWVSNSFLPVAAIGFGADPLANSVGFRACGVVAHGKMCIAGGTG